MEYRELETYSSPAFDFVKAAFTGAPYRPRNRCARLVTGAIMLAIEHGLRFNQKDFQAFSWLFGTRSSLPFWYVRGGEGYYEAAIRHGNESACKSFEYSRKRLAIMANGKRLWVGRRVSWEGQTVICTSFARDGQSATLCQYAGDLPADEHTWPNGKPIRRYTVNASSFA